MILLQFDVICTCKLYNDHKLHSPVLLSLKNLLVIINTKLHLKSCYYLYNIPYQLFRIKLN